MITIGLISYDSLFPAKIIFNDDKIEFTGSYGFELNLSEVESVEMLDKIPAIKIRTNGYSAGNVNKGAFRLESWGKCRLMLNSGEPPFLLIITKDGEKTIINNEDKSVTEEIYNYILFSGKLKIEN